MAPDIEVSPETSLFRFRTPQFPVSYLCEPLTRANSRCARSRDPLRQLLVRWFSESSKSNFWGQLEFTPAAIGRQ